MYKQAPWEQVIQRSLVAPSETAAGLGKALSMDHLAVEVAEAEVTADFWVEQVVDRASRESLSSGLCVCVCLSANMCCMHHKHTCACTIVCVIF